MGQKAHQEAVDIVKEAIKESISEWLDAKYATVGKWTLRGIFCFVFSFFAHAYITLHAAEIKAGFVATIDRIGALK